MWVYFVGEIYIYHQQVSMFSGKGLHQIGKYSLYGTLITELHAGWYFEILICMLRSTTCDVYNQRLIVMVLSTMQKCMESGIKCKSPNEAKILL